MVNKTDIRGFKEIFNAGGLVGIYFHSDWAAPSRAMKDVVDSASDMFDKHMRFVMADAEAMKELFVIFGVKSVPSVLLFENGKEVERIEGYLPLTELGEIISRRIV